MRTYCISHVKDVDGVGAAALVVAATGAAFRLADYDTLLEDLESVPRGLSEFVLCDLGSDDTNRDKFVSALSRLATRCKVTYVDHHYMPPDAKAQLIRSGVNVVHDTAECASMLCYKTFRSRLPSEASEIALYGAVTDYQDSSPMGKKLMEKADRQYILAEATLLSHAMARKRGEGGFPEMITKALAAMKKPHEIPEVGMLALEQLRIETLLTKSVKRGGRKMGRLAYMKTSQYSTGNVAKLLIGAFDVPVGVAFKETRRGWCEVSLRCTSECRIHLGRAIGRISMKLGGSGGGHKVAAGCQIPTQNVQSMLEDLAKKI